jgi:hypothetical protein
MFFLYVPYTESLFFLFSCMILIGLKNKSVLLVVLGVFLSALIRPTAIFLIPACLCLQILTRRPTLADIAQGVKTVLLWSLAVAAGIAVTVVVQYVVTGVWFAYFKAQAQHWQRSFDWPSLPLTTWDESRLMWLDGGAGMVGIVALVWLAVLFTKKIRGHIKPENPKNSVLIVSLAYVSLVFGSAVFFNAVPVDRTSIFGINRYLFVSPFLVPPIVALAIGRPFSNKEVLWVFGGLILTGALFGSYLKSVVFVQLLAMSACYTILLLGLQRNKWRPALLVLAVLAWLMQVILFDAFLSGEWVG